MGTPVALATAPAVGLQGALGSCNTDTFTVVGSGGSGSPIICGFNSGQHSK